MGKETSDTEWLAEAETELKDLLTWSDELPEEFIVSHPAYGRHKFRGNWFQGALSGIRLVADIYADQQLLKRADDFTDRKNSKGSNAKTTREEIDEVDQLIGQALRKIAEATR